MKLIEKALSILGYISHDLYIEEVSALQKDKEGLQLAMQSLRDEFNDFKYSKLDQLIHAIESVDMMQVEIEPTDWGVYDEPRSFHAPDRYKVIEPMDPMRFFVRVLVDARHFVFFERDPSADLEKSWFLEAIAAEVKAAIAKHIGDNNG